MKIKIYHQTAMITIFVGCVIWPMLVGCAGGAPKTRYTILLAQYNQADNIEQAQSLQERAREQLQSEDIWLEHDGQSLAVNYGHFTSHPKAKKQLKRAKELYSGLQTGPLQFSYIKQLPQPDPPAPPNWNLLNSRCYYTLEIATYFDVPEKKYFNRKTDAVKTVRKLREEGANSFFVHGRFESHVYVACLPDTAVQQVWSQGRLTPVLSPMVELLRKKYPLHYENSAKVFDIIRGSSGGEIRQPRPSVIVAVNQLRENVPF